MLRSVSRKFKLLNRLAGPTCRFDVLASGLGELRRVNGQLSGERAMAEDLDAIDLPFHQTNLAKARLVDRGAVVETLQVGEVHDRVFLLEDVGEATLRQAPMQRHLTAFETEHARVTGARLLPLLAAAGRLAVTRPRTSADALLGVARALLGLEMVQFHDSFLEFGCRSPAPGS